MIGGGSNMAIGISIFLRDNFSGPARGVSNSMQQVQGQANKMQQQQLQATRNLNAAGAVIGVGVLNQMRQWVKSGAEYGYTMKYVTEIAEGSSKQVAALDKRAKDLGQTTMFSTLQVADGMRFMAMAGMDAKQVYDNIGAAVNMSIATMTELGGKGGGADIMTNIMSAFQIGSQHATRVADIMTTATVAANINLLDLGESFKYAASTSRDLNVGLEETAAMIMMAGNAGIQGSMAGTAIENMLRYISIAASGESDKRNDALKLLGLSPGDLKTAQGNLKPIGELLTLIGQKAKSMELGGVDMQNVYHTLFGVRGKRQGSLMLRNMTDYNKFLSQLNKESQGSASRISGALMETPMGRMQQFTDTLENLKIAFTEALAPVIIPLLQMLTRLLQGLTAIMESGFGKFLTIVATGFIVWKTVAMGYRTVQASIKLLNQQIGSTFGNAATQVVGGYGRMTAAANAYGAAASRSSMVGATGAGMRGMSNVRWQAGQFMATGAGGGNIFLGKNANMRAVNQRYAQIYGKQVGLGRQASTMMAGAGAATSGWLGKLKPGNALKGGGLGLGLAGMGTEMAGNYIGGNLGQGIGVAGSTMSMAGTGAMLGSIIPGVGTAIGAVAGGLIGLTMGLMDWQDASDENTAAIEANTYSNKNALEKAHWVGNKDFWQSRLKMMESPGSIMSTLPGLKNPANDVVHGTKIPYGGEQWNLPGGNQTIAIYVDGEEAMKKTIDKKIRSNNLELGLGL